MAVDPLRPRQPPRRRLREPERVGQKATRPAGIDQKPGAHVDGLVAPLPFQHDAGALEAHLRQHQLVDVARALTLGFPHQPVIEVGAVPVRVGDRVVRAGRDQQLTRVRRRVLEGAIEIVAEEGEPALEPAGHVGVRRAPGPPLGERPQARQVPAVGELLEHQVGDRRGRLADGEARMPAAFEQRDGPALPAQDQGGQRAGESRSDDRDVGVDGVPRDQGHAAAAPHAAQVTGSDDALLEVLAQQPGAPRGPGRRRTSRARRGPRDRPDSSRAAASRAAADSALRKVPALSPAPSPAQSQGCGRFKFCQRSAGRTRPAPPAPASRRCRRGWGSARSRTPRRRSRCRSIAGAMRSARRAGRTAGARAGTRAGRCRARASAAAAAAKSSTVQPLFRRASASGCAVSSPIATSSAGPSPRPSPRADASRSRKRQVRSPISRGCDSTVTRAASGDRARDRRIVGRRHRPGIEEAARVVQLERSAYVSRQLRAGLRAELRARRSPDGSGGGSRRAAYRPRVVSRHRSHITQRHGHSRPVRNSVVTSMTPPSPSGSGSTTTRGGAHGSTARRGPRRASTKRSRAARPTG